LGFVVAWAQGDDIDRSLAGPLLWRLRALLAAADDSSYAEAVDRLGRLRRGPPSVRLATSFLLPTQQAWVDEDVAFIRAAGLSSHWLSVLLASATTMTQATVIFDASMPNAVGRQPHILYGLAVNVGPDSAPLLDRLLDGYIDADGQKRVLAMLGQFPTDEAFGLLLRRLDEKYVQPAVLEATARFPRRAMRLLPGAAAGQGVKASTARELLRSLVITHPDLADEVRRALSDAAGRIIDELTATTAALPIASDAELPPLLVTPPWVERVPRPKPIVVTLAAAPAPLTLAWRPGERDAWAGTDVGYEDGFTRRGTWPDLVAKAVTGQDWRQLRILALAPDELVRSRLRTAVPGDSWNAGPPLRRILGRFDDDAVDFVFRVVLSRPSTLADVLLPFEGADVAARMAEWHARSKAIRPVAGAWFDRHPAAAARDLVPAAVGKPGKVRSHAEAALRLLAQLGHGDVVRAAAEVHGDEAVAAVDAGLAVDPLELLPARIPARPGWLDPAHLPQVLLPSRTTALPPRSVEHIITMLAISKPDDPYPGLDVVRRAVDPMSLAEMAWAMFERWRGAGYPAKEGWVLDALGVVGDDETVRRLAPLIRAWPGEAAHTRAVAGLDVLAAIGTDVALMHLHGIAEKVKFRGLRTRARAKMDELADALGLTADQLADRLVPDFGLDDDGTLLLDYGDRRFRVGFDEQLKPTVVDEDGGRRKLLPKPGAKDDPVLAPAAYARFAGLKKDVKTVAADQIRRLERAMVAVRTWTAAEQRSLFIDHPLLWHLARRLVWAHFDERGDPVGSFRVAEDRTLADRDDAEIELPGDDTVGIAHPLHLRGTLTTWSELFADYEILQPFPQLGRETFALTDEERAATELTRLRGVKVPTGKILGLAHRGWERGMAQDAGIQFETYKHLGEGRSVVVNLEPGIIAGSPMDWAEQTIAGVWLGDKADPWATSRGVTFGSLDEITASELLRDLEGLRP
jgi:hypothetical protein